MFCHMIRYISQLVLLSFSMQIVASCSGVETKNEYPDIPEQERRKRLGSLTGEGGLISFGKKSDDETTSYASGIGINSYLWRATLDTISFMPLQSADPFGGVVITDWYQDPAAKGERFKINVVINSRSLRSDAVSVSVFKQTLNETGLWQDAGSNKEVANQLENKILTRAREFRVKNLK